MKAAEFDYARARDVAEACRLLAGANGEAKIIAGGQTLVPLMAMRLTRPALLVDIAGVTELQGIAGVEGTLIIGAGTRQADALAAPEVARLAPLLKRALSFVGHPQTRNRGTVGGSLANADPAAEICLAARTLGATLTAVSQSGEREFGAQDFFVGAMTTALAPEECLTAIHLPVWTSGRIGTGFEETSARKSDFALVAACVQLALDDSGVCIRAALGIGGVEPAPKTADAAAAKLVGTKLEPAALAAAASEAAEALAPCDDLYASAAYRRRVARALALRALEEAKRDALGQA